MRKHSRFVLSQRNTIISGILAIVLVIVVLQLWLFSATMDAYLRQDEQLLLPAALASGACFLLNLGLLWYLYALDR
jgi:hypothetical protein